MKTVILCVFVAFWLLPAAGQEPGTHVFVSAEWLAEHLKDPDLVLLHVAFSRPEYRLGHIPGARFLWFDWLAVSTPDASTEMPTAGSADTLLEGLGISGHSRIVLCFSGSSVSATTRMFLALSYFGLGNQTSILDGGLEAWKSGGHPVSTEPPVVGRTSLTLKVNPFVITDAEWVRSKLGDSAVAIVDARDRRFYDGNGGGISRTGHIRGAVSIPYTAMTDSTNRLKSHAALQTLFEEAGVRKGMTVVSYCHVGQQATVVYAVARELGYAAAVYDGSFQDWNLRGEEYPVDKTEPAKK